MKNRKKLIKDMIINIISFGVPIVILQFIVLPHFASTLTTEDYGLLLTLIALVSVISEMFIGTLSNVRILEDKNYKEKKIVGVFKALFYILIVVSAVCVFLFAIFLYKASIEDIVFLVIYYLLLGFKIYNLTAFRLENKYNSVMVNNLIISIGYLGGILLYDLLSIWQVVYIVPTFLSCVHLYYKTNLYKEEAIYSSEIKPLFKQTGSYMSSYIIGSGMSYLDRVFLYPILGPESVSVYQVSTLMGKLYSLIGAPINMVILSYTAKIKVITRKMKMIVISSATLFGIAYAFVSIFISPYVLRYLYPQYAEQALVYVPIVVSALTIFNVASIFRVISMKTSGHQTIFIIEIVYASVYILSAIILMYNFDLLGFCYATLIASITRYISYVYVNLKKDKNKTVSNNL